MVRCAAAPPEVEASTEHPVLALGSMDQDDELLPAAPPPPAPSKTKAKRQSGDGKRPSMFTMGAVSTQPMSVFKDAKAALEAQPGAAQAQQDEDDGCRVEQPDLTASLTAMWKPWRAYQDLDSLPRTESGASAAAAGQQPGPSSGLQDDSMEARYVHERIPVLDARLRARGFFQLMSLRRSIRNYSRDHVPLEVIEDCIRAAGTAPSAQHLQPWVYVVVSDPNAKRAIREVLQRDSEAVASGSASPSQIQMLLSSRSSVVPGKPAAPAAAAAEVGTFMRAASASTGTTNGIEDAPYIVVLMEERSVTTKDGAVIEVPRSAESCGLSAGIFVCALHNANLTTVRPRGVRARSRCLLCLSADSPSRQATVSPTEDAREAVRELLGRPASERVFLIMPVGYPASGSTVPYRRGGSLRKPLAQTMKIY